MPPDEDRRTRVLLVDDHALLRDGLREILRMEDSVVVVGEAANGQQALAAVTALYPDVVVLDVEMPGDDVTTTVNRILRAAPYTRILVLSVYDDATVVKELLALGIRGYLLKSINRHDFLAAVLGVHHDDERVVLSISRESLRRVNGGVQNGLLSQREREIMNLVAGAMSNAQIAHRLAITEGTVKRHLRNIFSKLGAVSRIDAVNKAVADQQLPAVVGPRGRLHKR
jgi:DNA-binding NarL/FixJ family response regulator